MNFNELTAEWQKEQLPKNLDDLLLEQTATFEDQLKRENLRMTYWLAGTIYFTGIIVIPFLKSEIAMLLLIGIWMLLSIQAMIFWLRQLHVDNSMVHDPVRFINAKWTRLKYNLLVTNVFMPTYVVLLGLLSSYYLVVILDGIDKRIVVCSIIVNWLFNTVVFFIAWNKQRKKDAQMITPQLIKLKELKASYEV